MNQAGYIGEKANQHGHWFVPTRFRDAWQRDGNKLVREVRPDRDGEFIETRPCVLSRAKKKSEVTQAQNVEERPALETAAPGVTAEPKKKARK